MTVSEWWLLQKLPEAINQKLVYGLQQHVFKVLKIFIFLLTRCVVEPHEFDIDGVVSPRNCYCFS